MSCCRGGQRSAALPQHSMSPSRQGSQRSTCLCLRAGAAAACSLHIRICKHPIPLLLPPAPQAFARLSAVYGGTYMLAKPDVEVGLTQMHAARIGVLPALQVHQCVCACMIAQLFFLGLTGGPALCQVWSGGVRESGSGAASPTACLVCNPPAHDCLSVCATRLRRWCTTSPGLRLV